MSICSAFCPPGGRFQHPLESGMQGDGACSWSGSFQLLHESQEMQEGALWDKSLQGCHTYGQAKLVWCDVAQASCETRISTALKSRTFPSRALEGIEKHTWASHCRFFFSSFLSPPSCKLILQVSQKWMEGRRKITLAQWPGSGYKMVIKCDPNPAIL